MCENQANQPGELRLVLDPEHFSGGGDLAYQTDVEHVAVLGPYWRPAPGVRVSREHDFSTFANFGLKLSATHARRNRRTTLQRKRSRKRRNHK